MMQVPSKLNAEILLYCSINNIADVDTFIIKLIKLGFNVHRYGTQPNLSSEQSHEELKKTNNETVKSQEEKPTNNVIKKDIYGEG